MAEWSKAVDSKSIDHTNDPGVRIPLSPPFGRTYAKKTSTSFQHDYLDRLASSLLDFAESHSGTAIFASAGGSDRSG